MGGDGMKITVEIDEKLLQDAVMAVLVEDVAKAVRKNWGEGHHFRNDTKAVMREVIRENMDEFAERAIAAAAKSIENRALKMKLEALTKGCME